MSMAWLSEESGGGSGLRTRHLLYGLLFLFTLAFRLLAAVKLEITPPEAELLISLTSGSTVMGNTIPIIYQVLTRPLVLFFGSNLLLLRLWGILAGSALVLFPAMLEDQIGWKKSLTLAVLVALDPFQIANSILVNGNALAIFFVMLATSLLLKRRFSGVIPAVLVALFSAQGIAVFSVPLSLFAIYLLWRQIQPDEKPLIKNTVWGKPWGKYFTLSFLAIGLILLLLQIPISDSVSVFISSISKIFTRYPQGKTPQLYPLALIAYFPIVVFLFLSPTQKETRVYERLLMGWCILVLLFISFYPGHQLLDLVWFSFPACLLIANGIDKVLSGINSNCKKVIIIYLVGTTFLVSLMMSLTTFVNQTRYGMNASGAVILIILLIVFISIFLVYVSLSESSQLAQTAFGLASLTVILVMQLTFSWRASGLTGHPENELMWGGYFQDTGLVRETLTRASGKTLSSGTDETVSLAGYTRPAVIWMVDLEFKTEHLEMIDQNTNYFAAISASSEDLNTNKDGFYGQTFVANSYPLWVEHPWREVFNIDFWSWLLWRQNQMVSEYDIVWVNKALF